MTRDSEEYKKFCAEYEAKQGAVNLLEVEV